VRQFELAERDQRAAFLRRAGVRRCVLPATAVRQWRVVAEVPHWNMRVFECNPGATRVFLASSVEIAPDPEDLTWQRDALFNPAVADDTARLSKRPAAPDRARPPETASVRIVEDGATTVAVEASTREAATLVLRDSYDPSWTADLDGLGRDRSGERSTVRSPCPGPTRDTVFYRPRDLRTGLIISGMTALTLLLVLLAEARRGRDRRSPAAGEGFT
jgi:hypothetical protein